jgi:hypothetical protein
MACRYTLRRPSTLAKPDVAWMAGSGAITGPERPGDPRKHETGEP